MVNLLKSGTSGHLTTTESDDMLISCAPLLYFKKKTGHSIMKVK
jgi:hypothetical protein